MFSIDMRCGGIESEARLIIGKQCYVSFRSWMALSTLGAILSCRPVLNALTPCSGDLYRLLTLTALKYFYINQKTKGFIQRESSSSRFIWIPMLWVYGHYKYFTLSAQGSTLDVRLDVHIDFKFWRIKSVPALRGLAFKSRLYPYINWSRCRERMHTSIKLTKTTRRTMLPVYSKGLSWNDNQVQYVYRLGTCAHATCHLLLISAHLKRFTSYLNFVRILVFYPLSKNGNLGALGCKILKYFPYRCHVAIITQLYVWSGRYCNISL